MRLMLNMLEPTIFPRAIWVFFLTAAAIEAASSGSDVPHAISVREMNASLTPKDFAMITALSTKKSQLVISSASPPATFTAASQSGVLSCCAVLLLCGCTGIGQAVLAFAGFASFSLLEEAAFISLAVLAFFRLKKLTALIGDHLPPPPTEDDVKKMEKKLKK